MTTQWTIAIDWDRDGSFDGTYDDVTEYVLSANWFVGMRRPYQDSANVWAHRDRQHDTIIAIL